MLQDNSIQQHPGSGIKHFSEVKLHDTRMLTCRAVLLFGLLPGVVYRDAFAFGTLLRSSTTTPGMMFRLLSTKIQALTLILSWLDATRQMAQPSQYSLLLNQLQSRMDAQVTLALFIAIAGLLVAAFLAYHLALTACGLTSYETIKRQQARTAQRTPRSGQLLWMRWQPCAIAASV